MLDQPAGTYFVKVFDNDDGQNPHYALTISPPGAPQQGFDLALGAVDLRDVTFLGRIDTDGNFTIAVDGTLVAENFTLDNDEPLAIDFNALVDNDQFTIGGSVDLTGHTIRIGDDPDNRILEIQGFIGTVDVAVPFDGGPITGGLRIQAASALVTPQWPINARVLGDTSNSSNVIPGLSGMLDFETGKINLDLHRFTAEFGEILEVRGDPSPQNEPAVRLTYDPNAAGTEDVLLFNEVMGTLPAVPGSPGVTLTGFGFQHDGTVFLTGASFSIPSETLEELGLPPILDITELGIASTGGDRITGQDLVRLEFRHQRLRGTRLAGPGDSRTRGCGRHEDPHEQLHRPECDARRDVRAHRGGF